MAEPYDIISSISFSNKVSDDEIDKIKCLNLDTIVIEGDIDELYLTSFDNCVNLKTITINGNVETIEQLNSNEINSIPNDKKKDDKSNGESKSIIFSSKFKNFKHLEYLGIY